jgi:hypothetical protein
MEEGEAKRNSRDRDAERKSADARRGEEAKHNPRDREAERKSANARKEERRRKGRGGEGTDGTLP